MSHIATALDPSDDSRWDDVRELVAEATAYDGTSPISDQALVAARLGKRELLGIVGRSGRLDAFGVAGEGEIDLVVRPERRGRGLGRTLIGELLTRVDRGEPVRAWVHGDRPGARVLLTAAGFTPARVLLRLALRPEHLDAALASLTDLSPTVTLQPFDPESAADLRALVRVNAAAFADHPEQGRLTVDDIRALMREEWFDPADLIFAIDDATGTVSGFTWIKTHGHPAIETELYVLGVDPHFSGRGLGRTLLAATLRRMATTHPERITLYVDGDNVRARELYERAGFTRDAESTQWERVSAT